MVNNGIREFPDGMYVFKIIFYNSSTFTLFYSSVNSITIAASDINGNKKLATDRVYKLVALVFGIVLFVLLIAVIILIAYVVSTNQQVKRLQTQLDDLSVTTSSEGRHTLQD